MNIIIIGAGLGGLTAAACLLQRGHQVRVFEQASQLGEVGAGIQMSANAMKVLDAIALRPLIEPVVVRPKAFEFRRFDDGELLHRIPLGEQHEQQHGSPYFQIHRSDLHKALATRVQALDAAAIRVNMRAVALHEQDEQVRVDFADGSQATCDLLVGADGIKSVVREHVVGKDQPVFTGQLAWRCTVPTADIPEKLRTDMVSSIWCGPKNHAVMYYLRAGTLLNFVGCVERPAEDESWTSLRSWDELDADYRGWHPMVRAVIESVDRTQCFRWTLNNRVPSQNWSRGRITMLGDAVHATLPYMAQGAAMAIEDAAVLSRAIELDMPLPQALQVYHQHRAPRTARVVNESSEMGELYHIHDAAQMKKAFADRNIARSRNEWLYPYNPWTATL